MPDPLAEYHFNLNPYHYVENNPLRYIDPFGLDKEDREERRRKRQERRHMRKYGGDRYLDEVVCVGNKPQSKSAAREQARNDAMKFGFSFTGEGGQNGTNTKAKTWEIDYDVFKWLNLWRNQKQYKKPGPKSQVDKSKVGVKAAAKASKSDKEILEENNGSSDAANPENQTIVRTYSESKYGDSDSVDTKFLVRIVDDSSVYRVKRRLKGTDKGRYITPEFKERTPN